MPNAQRSLRTPADASPLELSRNDRVHVLEQIYANRYFTNHGPLARAFEETLESILGINNVIAIGSESLAVLIALSALELEGEVIVPALGGRLVAQLAGWNKLGVRYCDIDGSHLHPKLPQIENRLGPHTTGVILSEKWGFRFEPNEIERLIHRGLKVVILNFDGLPSYIADPVATFTAPEVVHVFSFDPGHVVDTLGGGAIATTDGNVAARIRNIRSSYGAREKVPVRATCNGRFSELQAGLGLKCLERQEARLAELARLHDRLHQWVGDRVGIQLLCHNAHNRNSDSSPVLFDEKATPLAPPSTSGSISKCLIWESSRLPVSIEPDCPTTSRLAPRLLTIPLKNLEDAKSDIQSIVTRSSSHIPMDGTHRTGVGHE